MTKQLLSRIREAVMLRSDDAAIRIRATYQPQAGSSAKVYPPTYIAGPTGSRYHFEQRWSETGEAVDVVMLDSIQSQANRVERAMRENAQSLGIPEIVIEATLADRKFRISSLDAPHRSRDAYLLDSELQGVPFDKTEIGKSLSASTPEDGIALLQNSPQDLIFGVWDSHRGKRISLKIARSYTSEMIGWNVLKGKKAATKGDPLNLPGTSKVPLGDWRPELVTKNKKSTEEKLSELGHGMVPVAPEESIGGVSVQRITREAVLSLTGLARLGFPLEGTDATEAGRTVLAALALAGDRLAFGRAGLNLRSGSDLVLESESIEWLARGNKKTSLELDTKGAIELLGEAKTLLAGAGVEWNPKPVVLAPSQRLLQIIEQTFYVPSLDAAE